VERHYPGFVAAREAAGRPLPSYVQEEFAEASWLSVEWLLRVRIESFAGLLATI